MEHRLLIAVAFLAVEQNLRLSFHRKFEKNVLIICKKAALTVPILLTAIIAMCCMSGLNLMTIHESAEDYLEAILILSEQHGSARPVDIATHLGVSKPSVSFAMKRLRENGYVDGKVGGSVTLTEAGEAIARRILERHRLLTLFLMRLGVSEETARADACKLEHDLSDETFAAIQKHAQMHS